VDEVAALTPVLEDRGAFPFNSREAKIAVTPVYGFDSAWRGPYTLKKRSAVAGTP